MSFPDSDAADTKVRVFIGSSSASVDVAHAVQLTLSRKKDEVDVRVWDQDVFKLAQYNLESLLLQLERSQVGIFVFAPDDVVVMKNRTVQAVRDNVIFEFGLFVGRLGRERVFALVPEGADLHLPSDLAGVVFGEYNPEVELVSSVGPFCFLVGQAIRQLAKGAPVTRPTTEARSTEQVVQDVVDDIRSLVQKQLSTQYIGVFPTFLGAHVIPCLRNARTEIRVATNSASPAYFSDYEAWMEYRRVLKERKDCHVPVKCVWMAQGRLSGEFRHQFAKTEEEWRFLLESPDEREFQQHLGDLNERIIKEEIQTPEAFYEALTLAEAQSREWLRQHLGAENTVEVDLPMPLNLWVSDEKSAIFSIPAYGPNKAEYAFETREPNLVVALRAVWQMYRDNAVRPAAVQPA